MPKLLDLFCGAGGAAMGYHLRGFDVTGVDQAAQPRYPFRFIQSDALAHLAANWRAYDAIHASIPCQRYSRLKAFASPHHQALLDPLMALLADIPLPYVIENVEGCPLPSPVKLCGAMFGLRVYRHRLFQCSFPCHQPRHIAHKHPCNRPGYIPKPHEYVCVAGHIADIESASKAMQIHWMQRSELAQAIPPAYTYHVGKYLKAALRG